MAAGIEKQFEECLKSGKIKKLSDADQLIGKELGVASSDLEIARDGLSKKRWKWCTIQSYYSMFHTARALLFSKGFREKSHYCLRVALEVLFVNTGKLPEKFIDALQTAKIMRENADYEEEFSEVGAKKLVLAAEEFIEAAQKLLRSK